MILYGEGFQAQEVVNQFQTNFQLTMITYTGILEPIRTNIKSNTWSIVKNIYPVSKTMMMMVEENIE